MDSFAVAVIPLGAPHFAFCSCLLARERTDRLSCVLQFCAQPSGGWQAKSQRVPLMLPSWPSFGLVSLLQHASFLSPTKLTHPDQGEDTSKAHGLSILCYFSSCSCRGRSVSACSWEQQVHVNNAQLTSQACTVLSLLSFCLFPEEQTSADEVKLFLHLHNTWTALLFIPLTLDARICQTNFIMP